MEILKRLLLMLAIWGMPASLQAMPLTTTNSFWRFLPGTNEASLPDLAAWRQLNFKDSAWLNSAAPFFYGETIPVGTTITGMQNTFSTIFLRSYFVVTNLSLLSDLHLSAICDDGFVAWINGVQVAAYNAPAGTIKYNSLSSQNVAEPIAYQDYALPALTGYLQAGTNVLAVQVFNTSLGSSDLVFDAALDAALKETVPPVITNIVPAPGLLSSLSQVTVTFSEPVTGVNAEDLFINGVPATNMVAQGNSYTFSFPKPANGLVQISWSITCGITDTAVPPNPFNPSGNNSTWTYQLTTLETPILTAIHPPPGLKLRRLGQVEVFFNIPVDGVEAADLLINGLPATQVTGLSAGPYLFEFAPTANGLAQFSWRNNHGIVNADHTNSVFLGTNWQYEVNSARPLENLIINEFVAENDNGLKDEDASTEDWIEIFNPGTTAVSLNGWSLTDDPRETGKWVFPAVSLPAKGYLVVFASGKDRKPTLAGGRLHTNFKLNLAGEFLGLYSPDMPRAEVHSLAPAFPEQRNDYSCGLNPQNQWRYYRTPTPGAANGDSLIADSVEDVHFSVKRGFFSRPFNLQMVTPTPSARIIFTVNGSPPAETNGIVYTNPIPITTTRIIRAAAFKTNSLPSHIQTHTYLYGVSQNRLLLPALSLVTASNNLYGAKGIMETNPRNTTLHGLAWERPVSVELLFPNGAEGFHLDCGLRVAGGAYIRGQYDYRGSIPFNKYSFRLYFRGDYGATRLDYPWFPESIVQSFNHIALRAGMNDPTNPYIRDEMVRRMAADTGQVASHGTFAHFYLNGAYKGYYNPAEHINIDFLRSWHGGGELWDVLAQMNEVQEGTATDWNSLRTLITTKDPLYATNYLEISRRLDLVNFIDYLLPPIYAGTQDWPNNNWRAAREKVTGAKWRFYIWDAEWSFGFNNAVSWNTLANELNNGSDIANYYQRLKRSYEFRLLFADRIHKHFYNNGALSDNRLRQRYNWLKGQMSGSISGFNDVIGTSWIPQRSRYLMPHFSAAGLLSSSNAPVFNQFGGRVAPGFALTMTTATNGTVYYTSDGSDPRLAFSNTPAPQALVLAKDTSLKLLQSALLKARTQWGTNWSALTEAAFQVDESFLPLRITEIMYNPLDGDAFEFIELLNNSAAAFDLRGFSLGGLDFTFDESTPPLAPGARIVLIPDANPAAFMQRYPSATIGGIYKGRLANSGERLTIKDRLDRVLASVNYRDQDDWPVSADGAGFSLEINDPGSDPNAPANWHASVDPGGSPGLPNPVPPANPVRLNEIYAGHRPGDPVDARSSDWIEIFNSSLQPFDLSNWGLGKNASHPQYSIPAGSQIPPLGYLLIWCDVRTNEPGLHAGFGLAREGTTVFLFDDHTNRVDAISFGLQLPDYAIGRTGREPDWDLTEPTPGHPNEPARLATATNLVINELLANPSPGGDGWVELLNLDPNLPAALGGLLLNATNGVCQLRSLSFIGPAGYAQLWADQKPGAAHLDLILPPGGSNLALMDISGALLNQAGYVRQKTGVSQGRWPDGTGPMNPFPDLATPGASNQFNLAAGPVLNELLATPLPGTGTGSNWAWIEIHNPLDTDYDLAGCGLRIGEPGADIWLFPPGTRLAAHGFAVVRCVDPLAASLSSPTNLVVGSQLDPEGGMVFLFNASGQMLDLLRYGSQIPGSAVGRIENSWQLLKMPTPGLANAIATTLGDPLNLRLNEWLASSTNQQEWLELYNLDANPVSLSGLFLTDDPSLSGQTNYQFAQLSFIPGHGYLLFKTDGEVQKGGNHLPFKLDWQGETLRLYTAGFQLIDFADISQQIIGLSEGRVPDGGSNIVRLATGPTPGSNNENVAWPLQFTRVGWDSDHGFQLILSSPASMSVVLEISDDLAHWSPAQTNTSALGLVEFRDLPPGSATNRFYRALLAK